MSKTIQARYEKTDGIERQMKNTQLNENHRPAD
jgi:hypothetical protein